MATERLDIIVKLNDGSKAGSRAVKKNLKGVQSEADKTAKSIKRLAASFLGLTAIFAAGRGFANAVKTFSDFDDAMRQAGAVTQATAEEMEALTEIAQEMGKTTRFTANEAAEGLKFLGLAGFEAAEAVEALPGVLQLAAAGSLELGQAADITTNILAAFGFEVEDLGRVNDALVKTFTSSNNSLIEIGEAFKLVGPIAKGVGADFDDLLATIGKLGDAGIKASIGGTTLRGSLSALFNPTAREAKLMEELGQRIGGVGLQIKNSVGDFIGFAEIVEQLERASIDGAEALELFGLRAGPGIAALINQGSESLFQLREEIKASEGVAAEIAQKMEAGIGGAIRRLNAATESLKLTLIDTFGGELPKLIEKLTADINGLSEAIEENKRTVTLVGQVAARVYDIWSASLKKVTGEVIAIGRAIGLVGFILSKSSFTATVENSLETTKIIKKEWKEILALFSGKEQKQVKLDVVFDEEQAFKALEDLKFKIENFQFGFQEIVTEDVINVVGLETKLKAGLIKLNAVLEKESALLEQEFENGIIELDQYFEEREVITRRQLGKELQLLREKLRTEEDLSKKTLINAAIFAKEQQLQTELINLEQEKLKEFKKLERQKNTELEKQLQKRKQSEVKAAQADKLLNDLKIRNSIITSNKLEDVFKNEQIKLQQRQREELERFKKNTEDEVKLAAFANQQKLELEILLEQQKRRLKKLNDEELAQTDKLLNDLRIQNAITTSETIEDIQKGELQLFEQKQEEELAKFLEHTNDLAKIKDFAAQQDIERAEKLEQQQEAINKQRVQNVQSTAEGLSQIADDLFELSERRNKDLFKLSQAAAIALAIVNTAVGVTEELKKGGVFGIISGAIVAAAGAIQIAKISAQSFAEGGVIQGYSPHSKADNIPINATAGEGVLNVGAMKNIGPEALSLMNKQAPMDSIISSLSNSKPSNFNIPRQRAKMNFADGGIVPNQAQPVVQTQGNGIVINNIVDPNEIARYLNTVPGQNSVLNVISSRAKQVKGILA